MIHIRTPARTIRVKEISPKLQAALDFGEKVYEYIGNDGADAWAVWGDMWIEADYQLEGQECLRRAAHIRANLSVILLAAT